MVSTRLHNIQTQETNTACCSLFTIKQLTVFVGALDHLNFSYTSHALSSSQKCFKHTGEK